MDNYMNQYSTFTKKMVYRFKSTHDGGIADYIKFFMIALKLSIQYNIQLYLEKNNSILEQHLKLKYTNLYIHNNEIIDFYYCNYDEISNLKENVYNIITPYHFYKHFDYNLVHDIQDVFHFSNEVVLNSSKLCSYLNYTSFHLRLGDKFLETNANYIQVPQDIRHYNENNIFKIIEENKDNPILFLCDNNNYKLKIKNKYDYVHINNIEIGHTSLINTTEQQILDGVTEFYLLTNSDKIYACSYSGFSIIASKFKNIPLVRLY
jgi:hypothetical protein